MNRLKRLNPETNLVTRSLLYVIGIGGLLHFASLLIIAIKSDNSAYFNPLLAVDFDRVFPSLRDNPLTFFGGWLLLGILVYLMYRVLRRYNKKS